MENLIYKPFDGKIAQEMVFHVEMAMFNCFSTWKCWSLFIYLRLNFFFIEKI